MIIALFFGYCKCTNNNIQSGNDKCGGINMQKKKYENCTDEILTDPFGSYTGITEDPFELPVQEADDL